MRVEPTISAVSFNCPHCGALAHQHWYNVYAEYIEDKGTPFRPNEETIKMIRRDELPPEIRASHMKYLDCLMRGEVFLEQTSKHLSEPQQIENVFASVCFSCNKPSIWVHGSVVHPPLRTGIDPNADLPDDILRDYDEARLILNPSPRGAAALLRLAIQKLCAHLGEAGKNINDDIASLVRKGLDKRIQQALDIVRVIGNDAVHPGQIDLRDDRDTATKLFGLVNLIAEKMISEPKHVEALYGSLPESKRQAIEKRDQTA